MLHTADYGQRLWHVVTNGDRATYRTMDTAEFLQLDFCEQGDTLVIESAHLTPRIEGCLNISLAQALERHEADGLLQLSRQIGVEIRCFPQGETPKWTSTLGGEKDDAQDAVRLFDAVEHVGFKSLQKLSTLLSPTSALEEAGREVKQELNGILNYTRGLKSLQVTPCTKLLEDNLEAVYDAVAAVSPLAVGLFFDKETITCGPRKGDNFSITSAGVALWGAVVAHDGSLRLHRGKLWGINSLTRHVLNFRPMHQRGGIARSNLWFHNFGKRYRRREFNSVKYVGQDKLLRDADSLKIRQMKRDYRRACVETLRVMQQIAPTLVD